MRASKHIVFHRILARMTDNPIMIIVIDGVLDVLHHYVRTLGEYQNAFVLPSRRRFMKHMEEGNVDAAVAEMESSLKRLQRAYSSKVAMPEEAGAVLPMPALPATATPAAARKRAASAKTAGKTKA